MIKIIKRAKRVTMTQIDKRKNFFLKRFDGSEKIQYVVLCLECY